VEQRSGTRDGQPEAAVDQVVESAGESPAVAGAGEAVAPVGVRRRQRQSERRPHRLTPRFSEEELEALAGAGLTPTGIVAKVAVDVATARVRPVPTAVVDAIGELLTARYQVQKFSALVNQAVAKWHATEEVPAQLLDGVALVGRVLPRLEAAAAAVRAAQNDGRRRRVLAPRQDASPGGSHGLRRWRRPPRRDRPGVPGRGRRRAAALPVRAGAAQRARGPASGGGLGPGLGGGAGHAGAGGAVRRRCAGGVGPPADDREHGARDGAAAGVGDEEDGVALPAAGGADRGR